MRRREPRAHRAPHPGDAGARGGGGDSDRRDSRCRLEPPDSGLRLVHPPAQFQEAHRLRQPPADDDGVDRRSRTQSEGPPPAVGALRHHEIADQGSQGPADRPERLEEDHHATANLRGGVLADQGRGDGELGAEPETDEEAERQECPDRPRQRRRAGRHPEDQQGDREDLPPSEAVGQQPTERGAQRHPDEADRPDPGQLTRGDAPLLLGEQRRHHEGDEADVHRIQRPAQPGADDQPPVLPGEGEAIETLGAGGWRGRPGHSGSLSTVSGVHPTSAVPTGPQPR